MKKRCSKCKESKLFSSFQRNKKSKDGLCTYCKSCISERQKQRFALNPTRHKYEIIKSRYGINEQTYKNMLLSQNNKCALCKINTELRVDHNHNTKSVRGLLCHTCNIGLGMFKDNIDLLLAAIEYLKSNLPLK